MQQPKSRLLFIAPTGSLDSGGEVSHFELIKHAKARGYDVRVVLPIKGVFSQELKKQGIPHDFAAYGWWTDDGLSTMSLLGLEAQKKITEIAIQNKTDILVTNTLNIPWGALAASQANIPHVWIAREAPIEEFAYLLNRYAFIDNFSNAIIANSGLLRDRMKNEHKLKNVSGFRSFVDESGIRLSQATGPTRLIALGAVQPRKNQLELVKAMALLKNKSGMSPDLLIIGGPDADYKQQITEFAKKHDIQVTFHGFTKDPWSLVKKNDIYVQPSLSESIGRTVAEAMKLGLVCVGADIPGTKEAFSLGGGNLYKSKDTKQLASLLEKILADKPTYDKQALGYQKRAIKHMSEEASHQPFFDVLESVKNAQNPQATTVGSMSILFDAMIKNYRGDMAQRHEELLSAQRETIEYKGRLQAIENSRGWQTLEKIRKVIPK